MHPLHQRANQPFDVSAVNLHDFKGIVDDERSGCGADFLARVLGDEAPSGDRLRIQSANTSQRGTAGDRSETLRRAAPVHLLVDIFRFDARLLEILLVDGKSQNSVSFSVELNGAAAPSAALVE